MSDRIVMGKRGKLRVVVCGAGFGRVDLVLETSGEPPEMTYEQIESGESRRFYDDQAKSIADALHAALPGGTLDSLTAELMHRRACLLRVPLSGGAT